MKNEYISLLTIEDIEKTTSRPRQKAMLLNRRKKVKTEFKYTKHFAKNGQRILNTAFLKEFLTAFQKPNAKKLLNFY